MSTIQQIQSLLRNSPQRDQKTNVQFFKTGKDDYAAHDQFLGLKVPYIRTVAREHCALPISEIAFLLQSPFNEERLLALIILTMQYTQGSTEKKEEIYRFYLNNLAQVNNWNLVDSSAHLILGAHILKSDKKILITLAQSPIMWERRIAMVATWHFGKNNQDAETIKIAELLLNDKHDLIHKAVGWMLREMGKYKPTALIKFLDAHAHNMPRTMLRYAIEKFPEDVRQKYLLKKHYE